MSESKGLLRGSVISIGAQVASTFLRLGSNILLAYLLVPALFGVATLVNTVIVGLEMISDIGLDLNIIQSEQGEEPDFLHTAYTVQVIRGALLLVASCIVAAPVAWFYDTPELMALIPFAGLGAFLRGFTPTKLAIARRHVLLGRVVLVELGSSILGTTTMCVHAYIYRSVWSLVLGAAVFAGFRTLLSMLIPGPLDKLRIHKPSFESIFGFAKWVLLSTLLTFVADRFVTLSMGKVATLSTLGVFGVASTIALLPMSLGGHAINSVLLPALSAAARQGREALERVLFRSRRSVMPIFTFLMISIALAAHPFFDLLYEDEWSDAPWMVQLSLAGVWFAYFQEAWSRVLVALGDTRPLATANVVKVFFTVLGCGVGFLSFQIPGLILGAALGNFAGHATITWFLYQRGIHTAAGDLGYTLLCFAITVFGIFFTRYATTLTDLPTWLASTLAAIPIIVAVGVWALLRLKNRNAGQP